MDITVQDYEEIRQCFLAGESQRHIAKTLGISRNTAIKCCDSSAVPWERKTPERESSIIKDDITALIRACLQEDGESGIKKQRHPAKRIYDRLVAVHGFTRGESTIRIKVREIRIELPKVYIPLQFSPGESIQIDWGVADISNKERKERINHSCARLCFNCRPVVLPYLRQMFISQ